MKIKSKKKILTIDELVANAKKVLKGKQLNDNNKELFEETLKQAAQPKKAKPRNLK